ncbi:MULTISPECIES: hypothetical protein [Micromonospora]|uniref:hypothetical protein n=1 Tax=Micromonospora TaxID=1873 RepID=UPI001EE80829|nr:hypothetical protein [Micromonospora hortensis]WTI10856.1 hypothetical protein OHB44_14745 [Micromonospora sp. NBC_00821]
MVQDVARQVAEQVRAGFGLRLSTMEPVTSGADQHARLAGHHRATAGRRRPPPLQGGHDAVRG